MLHRKTSIPVISILILTGMTFFISGCAPQQKVALPGSRRLPPVVSPPPAPTTPKPVVSGVTKAPQPPITKPRSEPMPTGPPQITTETAIEEPLASDQVESLDTTPAMPADSLSSLEPQSPPAPPPEPPQRQPSFSEEDLQYVEQRLVTYEKKFQLWLESTEGQSLLTSDSAGALQPNGCTRQFKQILNAYRELRNQMAIARFSPWHHVDANEVTKLHRMDIKFLEGECASSDSPDPVREEIIQPEQASSRKSGARKAEAMVEETMKRGHFYGVISEYQDLIRNFPEYPPSATTKEYYGIALLQSNQRTKAAAIFSELTAASMSDAAKVSPWQKQIKLADLLLASGNIKEATTFYNALSRRYSELAADQSQLQTQIAALRALRTDRSEETSAYLTLFRGVILFDGKEDGPALMSQANRFSKTYPSSPLGESGRHLSQIVEEQLTSWAGQKLRVVNQLIKEEKVLEAQAVLEELAVADLPPAVKDRVESMLAELSAGETQSAVTQETLEEEALSVRWDAANNSLDAGNYDEAIMGYTSLLGTEYAPKARIRINSAAEKAAIDNRRNAATLFVKATRTADPEEKRTLLISSRKLLQESLEKYPQAEIMGKVRQNLENLDQYILRFDPSLLEKQAEAEQSPVGFTEKSPEPLTF